MQSLQSPSPSAISAQKRAFVFTPSLSEVASDGALCKFDDHGRLETQKYETIDVDDEG